MFNTTIDLLKKEKFNFDTTYEMILLMKSFKESYNMAMLTMTIKG